jgi:malate dehydrogenase (oxaloacetate-decarboxylating)(NADP+)
MVDSRTNITDQEALLFHSQGRPGKLEIRATKPLTTQRDLSLAYSPGVAVPCLRIAVDPGLAYDYTAKGNLVAVISNGTAVLGLGDLGAQASKPVMEGKAVLFKRFADIDSIDLEVSTEDPDAFINCVKVLGKSWGGINLEDIKAPECFIIEQKLRELLDIPVFHDDQHGTAIISGAGLLNAVEILGKEIGELKVVFNGAGAAAISCAAHYVNLGVRRENIVMCDTKGVIYEGRTEHMNAYKARYASTTKARTLAEALDGADVFFGLSSAGCVTAEMVLRMAPNPIIFALANPDPEIAYDVALAARPDAIVATGRSDYPNQVNNVLGFPFIFRGALDVRATTINNAMQLAATRALAALAKADVPDSVLRAYGVDRLEFGREYIIPKPFDPRVLIWEASAVAQAAMETGVAQQPVDLEQYREELEKRLGKAHEMMRAMIHKAQRQPKRVVFTEGEEAKVLRACQILLDEKIAFPILLGDESRIRVKMAELRLSLGGAQLINPRKSPRLPEYIEEFYSLRHRKGITRTEAEQLILNPTTFGSMMVRLNDADAVVGGLTTHYPDTIRPALQVIEVRPELRRVAGVYVLITPKGDIYFLADATVNIEPTSEDLAEIAIMAAEKACRFNQEPRVAMLSFSNFGSTRHPLSEKVRRAVDLVRQRAPGLMIDGEMQADTAVLPSLLEETYPFSTLKGGANVLVFPNLEAGNIAYKLLHRVGGCELIGPLLTGLSKPVHVLQRGSEVNDIVHVAAVAVVDAQEVGKPYTTLGVTVRR